MNRKLVVYILAAALLFTSVDYTALEAAAAENISESESEISSSEGTHNGEAESPQQEETVEQPEGEGDITAETGDGDNAGDGINQGGETVNDAADKNDTESGGTDTVSGNDISETSDEAAAPVEETESKMPLSAEWYAVSSGICGDNLTWTLDGEGTLTISGTGAMYDFSYYYDRAPWNEDVSSIKKVVIKEGITGIGEFAFYHCFNMKKITIPQSVTNIGAGAFQSCSELTEAAIPQGVTVIEDYTFAYCVSLTEVRIPESVINIGEGAFSGCGALRDIGYAGSEEKWKTVSIGLNNEPLLNAEIHYNFDTLTYTVTFDSRGGSAVADVTLGFGQMLGRPDEPVLEGYAFCGWYSDEACTEYYSFPGRIVGNLTLYAKWTKMAPPLPSSGNEGIEISDNAHKQDYGYRNNYHGKVINSYLVPESDGGFCRVDYNHGVLIMEQFRADLDFADSWFIPMELPIFGGFYAGSDGYYFVFGQENLEESNETEVVRIVKYSKKLERIGAASLYGANTVRPFRSASLRMDEAGDFLYIRTGHLMYFSYDGLRHQANMTIIVNTKLMEIADANYIVGGKYNYVSHSFNQFIRLDGEEMIALDHGDGYPRAAEMYIHSDDKTYKLLSFTGDIGENYTGASLGGLEYSDSHYLAAGNTVDQNHFDDAKTHNIFLATVSRKDGAINYQQVTDYAEDGNYSASTPQLVRISDSLFALMWEVKTLDKKYGLGRYSAGNKLALAFFDGEGRQLGGIQNMEGSLSDCQPVMLNDYVTWYVADKSVMHLYRYKAEESGGSVKLSGVKKDLLPMTTATVMGYCDFYDCTNLKYVNVGDGVTEINWRAFNGCSALAGVYIPASVTLIDSYAFQGCSSLKDVYYGGSKEQWASMEIRLGNDALLKAAIHYDSQRGVFLKKLDAPTASISSGSIVRQGTQLILKAAAGAQIYYTLDGSQPTTNSAVYTQPIVITEDLLIKAFAIKEGCEDSVMAEFFYIVDAEEQGGGLTVSFDAQGGSEVAAVSDIEEGSTIALPRSPVKEGCLFGGWYTQPDGMGEKFTSSTIIRQDMTVYAKWMPKTEEDDIGDILEEDIPGAGSEEIPHGLWIAGIDPYGYTYTGKAVKPEIRVYDYKTELTANRDYTVSYKNNIKAAGADAGKNAPAVIVKGKGNYSGTDTAYFTIRAKSVADEDVSAPNLFLNYNGRVQKPVPSVLCGSKKLKNKTDFSVEYPKLGQDGAYKENGVYRLLIRGQGNYTGVRAVAVTITDAKLMQKAKVSKIAGASYTGREISIDTTGRVKYGKTVLKEGVHYYVKYQNNIEVGTATMTLVGTGASTEEGVFAGEKTLSFKITGEDIRKAKVEGIPRSVVYTGEEIREGSPGWSSPISLSINGEEIKDYTIEYQKNIDAGKAVVVFKGTGACTGTLKKTFMILPYAVNDGEVEAKLEGEQLYAKGGNKAEPVVTFGGKELKKGSDYTLSYRNNKQTDGGEAVVVIKGKKNFKGSFSLTYTIQKQDIGRLSLTVSDTVYLNKKNAYKSKPKLVDLNGSVLKAGTDYEKAVTYQYGEDTILPNGELRHKGDVIGDDIPPAGTLVEVSVTAKGNYAGTITGCYRVVKANISKAKVTVDAQTYTGGEILPDKGSLTVMLGKERLSEDEYEIVEGSFKNNVNKGTASFAIRGTGDYGGTKVVKYKIKAKGMTFEDMR